MTAGDGDKIFAGLKDHLLGHESANSTVSLRDAHHCRALMGVSRGHFPRRS
jgi:hypothetical protein